jgi:hypothetical protein
MTRTTPMNSSAAVLWASAFIIAALVIIQAGRLPGNPAHADMAIHYDDFTLLTTRYGSGDNKLLYVINSRDQVMLVYEVEDAQQGTLFLRDGGSIENLFRAARRD